MREARLGVLVLFLLAASGARAQTQNMSASPVVASAPLPMPAMTGPLQAAAPITLNAGPLGKILVTGVVSGIGLWQAHRTFADQSTHGDLSNAQVFLQKVNGWWQYYIQAGVYNLPTLGAPFLSTGRTTNDFYGPLPVAYLKLVPSEKTSIQIGALPTLVGAEYTFTFENMNIERGLLWAQENAVNRGIQVNQTMGKFTASLSWNDGYYSDRFSSLSGSLTYTNGPNSVAFAAMGNLGRTRFQTLATPVQNNGTIYTIAYTYAKGPWIVQPYFQYGKVPTNLNIGVSQGAAARGAAILLARHFGGRISLAGRGEYIASTGSASTRSVNLIYGPGSSAWSLTLTPTYQDHGFFLRGELSYVRAIDFTPGDGFGPAGLKRAQTRALLESGFMF